MRILLTGATGYVGKRLLPILLQQGHTVICCVRDKNRFRVDEHLRSQIEVVEVDFLEPQLDNLPKNIDAAYYLIHSMSIAKGDFEDLESTSAKNFKRYIETTTAEQVIYLSGIVNEDKLSKHLASRKNVESVLACKQYHLTVLRAGIIVGSGSSSFEIIRDLSEKLPVMIAPKWLNTRCQPIAIRDVISYLVGVLHNEKCYDTSFDIGGPDILTYEEMLQQYCHVRGLKRWIITVPVMTPRLSSYWLYFVTSISYPLAVNLVNSMKVEVICRNDDLEKMLQVHPIRYKDSIELAFQKIEQNLVASSWKDSFSSSRTDRTLSAFIEVPKFGCLKDEKSLKVTDPKKVIDNIWAIGGGRGWYYGNRLWRFRGFLDKLFGGVGLRRGRTHPTDLHAGDALDFWRVLFADKESGRLLLFAEMKVPGEAWLEFRLDNENVLHQTATFRPKGLLGRMYWVSALPFHYFVFNGMIRNIVKK